MVLLQWHNVIRACVAVCTVLIMFALAFANSHCSEFGYGWVWFVLFGSIAWLITMTLVQRTGRWQRLDLDKNLVVMTYGGLIAVLMVSCCIILLAASTQPIHRANRTTPASNLDGFHHGRLKKHVPQLAQLRYGDMLSSDENVTEFVKTTEASSVTTSTPTTTTMSTTTELTPPPAHTIAPTPTTLFTPPPIQVDKNIEHLITTPRPTVSTSSTAEVNSDYVWHAADCDHKLPLVIATVKNLIFPIKHTFKGLTITSTLLWILLTYLAYRSYRQATNTSTSRPAVTQISSSKHAW